jgi:hypothetical protein
MGLTIGKDGTNISYLAIGLTTPQHLSLILESSKNIRLTAEKTNGNIYLEGNEFYWNGKQVELTGNTTAVFG